MPGTPARLFRPPGRYPVPLDSPGQRRISTRPPRLRVWAHSSPSNSCRWRRISAASTSSPRHRRFCRACPRAYRASDSKSPDCRPKQILPNHIWPPSCRRSDRNRGLGKSRRWSSRPAPRPSTGGWRRSSSRHQACSARWYWDCQECIWVDAPQTGARRYHKRRPPWSRQWW